MSFIARYVTSEAQLHVTSQLSEGEIGEIRSLSMQYLTGNKTYCRLQCVIHVLPWHFCSLQLLCLV